MNRRNFIKNSMLFAGSLAAVPSLILSRKAYAAWPKKSFDIKDLTESVSSVYGHSNLEESSKVKLKAPEIAENGAIVPINVCLLYTSPSPRDLSTSRMPSSA